MTSLQGTETAARGRPGTGHQPTSIPSRRHEKAGAARGTAGTLVQTDCSFLRWVRGTDVAGKRPHTAGTRVKRVGVTPHGPRTPWPATEDKANGAPSRERLRGGAAGGRAIHSGNVSIRTHRAGLARGAARASPSPQRGLRCVGANSSRASFLRLSAPGARCLRALSLEKGYGSSRSQRVAWESHPVRQG